MPAGWTGPCTSLAFMSPKGTKTTFLSLVVMVAAFFVPAARDCSSAPWRSPAEYAVVHPLMFSWIVPVFLGAAAMALLTARVLAARAVERGVRRGALVTVAAVGALNVVGTSLFLAADSFPEWSWLVLAALGMVAGGALIRRARGRGPLAIWDHLVAAFACAAVTSGPATYFGLALAGGHSSDLAAGAYLFTGAALVLFATSLVRALKAR